MARRVLRALRDNNDRGSVYYPESFIEVDNPERLKKLVDMGILSEEEYDMKDAPHLVEAKKKESEAENASKTENRIKNKPQSTRRRATKPN